MTTEAYYDQQRTMLRMPVNPTYHREDVYQLSNIQEAAESNDGKGLSAMLEQISLLRKQCMGQKAKVVELRKEATLVVDELYAAAALIMPIELRVLLNSALRKVVESLKMGSWDNLLKSHSSHFSQSKIPLPNYIRGMFQHYEIPPPSLSALDMLCDYGRAHLRKPGNVGSHSVSQAQIRYAITGPFEYPCRQVLEEIYTFRFGISVYEDRQDDVLTTSML
ncbi:hypothetical protein EDD16DRAFT_1572366 [Pisolithus croceorrhizus]|nr:hypothetical protein EDD16DRAFT_1572366 [Pisolithus croceorrhizus]KAI6148976.1 hypothetical protein EDD17DRAFT_1644946 [Pisolithus thermaeus]